MATGMRYAQRHSGGSLLCFAAGLYTIVRAPLKWELSATTSSQKKRRLNTSDQAGETTLLRQSQHTACASHSDSKINHRHQLRTARGGSPAYLPSSPRYLPSHIHDEVLDTASQKSDKGEAFSSCASSPSAAYAGLSLESQSGGDNRDPSDSEDLRRRRSTTASDGAAAQTPKFSFSFKSARDQESAARHTKHQERKHGRTDMMGSEGDKMDIDSGSVPGQSKQRAPLALDGSQDQVMDSIESTSGSSSGTHSNRVIATVLPPSDEQPPSIDEQVEQVMRLAESHQWLDGQLAYLVSKEWLWRPIARSSMGASLGKAPKEALDGEIGPVDNSSIMLGITKSAFQDLEYENGLLFIPIRDDLVEKDDYEYLPEAAWNLLVKWYGLAEGSSPILRMSRVSPEEVIPQSIGTIELNPPIFQLRKIESETSASTQRKAPITLSSIHEPFKDFVVRAKSLLDIQSNVEVRIWSLDESQESSSIVGTPLPSRNASPAPKARAELDTNKSSIISLGDFLTFSTPLQRDLLTRNDTLAGSSEVDRSSVSAKGLTKTGTYVLECQIGGPAGGEWPTETASRDLVKASTSSQQTSRLGLLKSNQNKPDSLVGGIMTRGRTQRNGRVIGKCGLQNLGNTCYMNSALQCIRSVEELTKYFLSDEYLEELNFDNPLAYNGEVARAYGHLIHQIYKKDFSGPVAPRPFKAAIGRFNSSFLGYGQQDSQEFLGFLLDALNEDLCRIKKKPYVSHPDSTEEHVNNPEALRALANQVWEGHVSRNESVVTDLFAGLYKSTLVCPVCGKISITFDPFNTLTLQLPQPPFAKKIHFSPLSGNPLEISLELEKHSSIRTLKEFVSKRVGVEVERLQVAEIYSNKFYRHYTDAEDATDSIVDNDDIVVYEMERPWTNVPEPSNPGMVDFQNLEEGTFDQMLTPIVFAKRNMSGSSIIFGIPTYVILTPEETKSHDAIFRKVLQKVDQSTTHDLLMEFRDSEADNRDDHFMISATDDSDSSGSTKIQTDSIEGEDGFVNVSKGAGDKQETFRAEDQYSKPVNHAVLNSDVPIPDEFRAEFKLRVWKGDGELIATKCSSYNNIFPLLEPQQPIIEDSASEDEGLSMPGAYGSLSETTTSDAISQSSPNAYQRALEEQSSDLSDDDEAVTKRQRKFGSRPSKASHTVPKIPLIKPSEGIMMEISAAAFDSLYGGEPEGARGVSTWDNIEKFEDQELEQKRRARANVKKDGISLEDCLDEFEHEEVLSEQDQWYCNKCKLHRRATKQLELWKTPDILVVHLKRFSAAVRAFRDKVDTLVRFPVSDLDLTKRISSKEDGKEYIYDLFAVDNHYGGLGGGHYTAFAQNFVNGVWYDCNDTSVSQVKNVDSVVTSAAYLLFYRRRSDKTLGGPMLAKIVEDSNRAAERSPTPSESRAESPSAPAGDGRFLDDSFRNGSSRSLHGSEAGARSGLGANVAPTAPMKVTANGDDDDQDPPSYSRSTQPQVTELSNSNWTWEGLTEKLNAQRSGAGSVRSAHAGSQTSNPDERMQDFEGEDTLEFDADPVRPQSRASDVAAGIPDLENDAAIEDVRISNAVVDDVDDPPVVDIRIEKGEDLHD